MWSVVEADTRRDKEVVENSGEFVENTVKEVEISQKVVPFLYHNHNSY